MITWYEETPSGERKPVTAKPLAYDPNDPRILGPAFPFTYKWQEFLATRVTHTLPGEHGWYSEHCPRGVDIWTEEGGIPGWVCEDPGVSTRGHPGYALKPLWLITVP